MNRNRCGGWRSPSRTAGCASWASRRCWIASSSRRCCRSSNADGTRTFSPHSYGFRPGRSAHQAVAQAQQYIADGYDWVVDLDLEKFFDRVNHDKLMGRIAQRVDDPRLRRLIRAFLNAGVMENGLVGPSVDGTPQGGPLSPLLSNLVLDDLDRELERRGLRFVRYADDCNIYVRTERAGHRVMDRVTRFLADAAQAHGQRIEECGGAPAGADVSRLHLHRRPDGRPRDCAQGRQAVQDEGAGDHATGQRRQPGDDDSGTGSVHAGLAQLFRLLRNARGAGVPHALGPLAIASGAVATMENTLAVVARRCSRWGSVRDWPSTRPAAGSARGTSRGPRPSRWGSPMRTSIRSAFRD